MVIFNYRCHYFLYLLKAVFTAGLLSTICMASKASIVDSAPELIFILPEDCMPSKPRPVATEYIILFAALAPKNHAARRPAISAYFSWLVIRYASVAADTIGLIP